MRIDVMEFKLRNNKIKVIVVVVMAILFIVFFSILGMHYAKMYKSKLISDKKAENEKSTNLSNIIIATEDITLNTQELKDAKERLLPVYSENAKKRIDNIYKSDLKVAYLTFDDGPSTAVTPLILDLLKQEKVKATFFVLGSNVNINPDIVKRAYEEGHYIANHGYSHKYSKIYADTDNALEEYKKTEKEIQKAIGNKKYSSHLFRFPGGYTGGKYAKIKKEAGKILNKNGISYIDWNVLTGDAEGANTKEKILKNIKKYTKDKGAIVVLMHDSSSKILTYETLKDVIEYLRKEGYTFDNFYSIMQ